VEWISGLAVLAGAEAVAAISERKKRKRKRKNWKKMD
jgi:hypothetical protein